MEIHPFQDPNFRDEFARILWECCPVPMPKDQVNKMVVQLGQYGGPLYKSSLLVCDRRFLERAFINYAGLTEAEANTAATYTMSATSHGFAPSPPKRLSPPTDFGNQDIMKPQESAKI